MDGAKITIGAAATTRMMCAQPIMEQEAQYLAAIQLAATYNVQGSRLDLRSAEDALQATYTRQPAAKRSQRRRRLRSQLRRRRTLRTPTSRSVPLRMAGSTTITLHLDPDGSAEFASS